MFLVSRGFLKKGTDPTQVGFLIKGCDDDFGVFKLFNQNGYHLLIGVGLYEKMRVRNQGLDNLHGSESVHGMVRGSSTCIGQVSEVINHALSVFVIRGFHVGQTRPGDINSLSRTETHVFLQGGRPTCILCSDMFLVGRGFLKKKGTQAVGVYTGVKSCDVYRLIIQPTYKDFEEILPDPNKLGIRDDVFGCFKKRETTFRQGIRRGIQLSLDIDGHIMRRGELLHLHIGRARPWHRHGLGHFARAEMHVYLPWGQPLCNLGWDTFFKFHDVVDIWVSVLHQFVHDGIYNVP